MYWVQLMFSWKKNNHQYFTDVSQFHKILLDICFDFFSRAQNWEKPLWSNKKSVSFQLRKIGDIGESNFFCVWKNKLNLILLLQLLFEVQFVIWLKYPGFSLCHCMPQALLTIPQVDLKFTWLTSYQLGDFIRFLGLLKL